ncbi:MAG: hypothetical protein JKY48_15020 [Flavobacteriales bacterium]|nr:hypothetical protein [Flavobacteriales bacterium]
MTIKWIDSMLIEWGDYMHDSNNLGYPSSSIEHRMKQGCFGGGSAQVGDGYVPGDIEKTEAGVLALPHELQATVNVVYTSSKTTREQYARRLGRRLGTRVSRDKLNKMLDQSHTRLAGFFDGVNLYQNR